MKHRFTFARSWIAAYLILSVGIGLISPIGASVACNETSTCAAALRPGSACVDGFCTNPFSKGCLNTILGDEYKIRTCNSEDEHGAECVPSPLNYEEVRIAPANWESAMFYGWVNQIILSEILDVPTSIETHTGGGALNFYDKQNSFAYPKKAAPLDALYKANEVGDCLNTDEPCAHFITEVWQSKREVNDSAVEREGNGMVAHVGWYTPKFVAQQDSSVTHYLGLIGDANRQKLADMFKRPMRWIDYCTHISEDNCTSNDGVASRAPVDVAEGQNYFMQDEYTGHFIHTERNNCTANPNCTGHLIDYPCTWSAYTAAQLYWNDIPLESEAPNGTDSYSYSEILQIIEASNATQSPIIVVWWYPDPTMDVHDYVQVALPKTTRECLDNRADPKPDRCSATVDELFGKEVGACGYNTHTVEKFFARSFRERSIDTPIASRSPGQQFARNLHLSDIDLTGMMVDWVNRGVDKWNYDPREAVCSWVAENYENGLRLKKFLPIGYPRVVTEEAGYNTGFMHFCIAFGVIGSIISVIVGGLTYLYRKEKQIRFAQEFFLYLFSLGLFLVDIGASLYGAVPSAGSCVARWWFTVIGFTLVFVPLLIKICAINKLMNDSKKCRVTKVSKEKVYKVVGALVLVVALYLSIWTGVDAPSPESELVLRYEGGNEVDVYVKCSSDSVIWEFIAIAWEGVLICCAAAVAYLSRKIPQAFNESRIVGNVAYVAFMFFIFKFLIYIMPESVLQPSLKNALTSLFLTLESLVLIGMYFGVKFYSIYKHEDAQEKGSNIVSRMSSVGSETSYVPKTSTVASLNYSNPKTSNDERCPLCQRPKPDSNISALTRSLVESDAETPATTYKMPYYNSNQRRESDKSSVSFASETEPTSVGASLKEDDADAPNETNSDEHDGLLADAAAEKDVVSDNKDKKTVINEHADAVTSDAAPNNDSESEENKETQSEVPQESV